MKELAWFNAVVISALLLICTFIRLNIPLLIIALFLIAEISILFLIFKIVLSKEERLANKSIPLTELFVLFIKTYYYELRFKSIPFSIILLCIPIAIFVMSIPAGILFVITGAILFFTIDNYRRKKKRNCNTLMTETQLKEIVETYKDSYLSLDVYVIIRIKIFEFFQRKFLIIKEKEVINDSPNPRKECPLCKEKGFLNFIVCKYGWKYIECRQCRFIYLTNVRIFENDLKNIYDQKYSARSYDPLCIKGNKDIARVYLKDKKPGKLLEIGCSIGSFLEEAQKMGFEVEGCEFELWGAEIAQKNGFSVRMGNFEELDYQGEAFDYIIAISVIEHFLNPLAVLKKIFRILKKKGYLFIYMPDITLCTGRNWEHFKKPCEHLNFFTLQTFNCFAEKLGYKILSTGQISHMREYWIWFQKIC